MDFAKNIVLKENYAFLVADADGSVHGRECGLYHRDTRFLSTYVWDFGPHQTLLSTTSRLDRYAAHHTVFDDRVGHPLQLVGVRRDITMRSSGFEDRLVLENTGPETREIVLTLRALADFADLFEIRGWLAAEVPPVAPAPDDGGFAWRHRASDGLILGCRMAFSAEPDGMHDGTASFRIELRPGEVRELVVRVEIDHPLEVDAPAIDYGSWRERFAAMLLRSRHPDALSRSVDDLRGLLLFTEDGPVPAAGIPWFVAAFGRDALLTCFMMLEAAPDVAGATLSYLARHQGTKHDTFQAEAPGKIMHELRFGEMARTGRVPFRPYYGSVDATPLWVMLLHAHRLRTGSLELARRLEPSLDAALAWMDTHGDRDGDGFLEFQPGPKGEGLVVQSWKDSFDSMSHADGSLATGDLAVSEVQGYAYGAYAAAAALYADLGKSERAVRFRGRAARLQAAFHDAFWLEDLGTYAMALDGDKRPLRVHNSDAGHLLWAGIVPEASAARLARTLMSPDNFSGWGIRTLGACEARYNPVSYHNGSVWPHDTAIAAGGLARYGFLAAARRLRDALFDVAATQHDLRPPELIGGYGRIGGDGSGAGLPPVPYPSACRPQAWDAAALVYLEALPLDAC